MNIAITGTTVKVLSGGSSQEVSGLFNVFRPNVFVEVLHGKISGIFEKFAIDAISDISRKHVVCEISLAKVENPYKRYCRENVTSAVQKLLQMQKLPFAELAVVAACEQNVTIDPRSISADIIPELSKFVGQIARNTENVVASKLCKKLASTK